MQLGTLDETRVITVAPRRHATTRPEAGSSRCAPPSSSSSTGTSHPSLQESAREVAREATNSGMLAGLLMAKLGAVAGMLWRPSAAMPGGISGWLVYLLAQHVLNHRSQRRSVSSAHRGFSGDDWTAPTLRPGTTTARPHQPVPSTAILLGAVFATLLVAVILSDAIGLAL